ncbi:unnamed protein product [Brassica oleracea var. botrytis]|uniref:Uncharacterized protein n=2 Tax=Brassica oleracea TaxID=3712 RepID=A0A0D3A8S9_BRAOL|nr:unnamed protein product [Brassica oleracea]
MENKNQEEASIIEVSTLTCIDLANSDLHQLAVFLKQRGIERPGFRAEQEVIHPSFGTEDEGLGNEKFRGYVPICDQLLDPKNQVQGDYKEGFTIGTEGF